MRSPHFSSFRFIFKRICVAVLTSDLRPWFQRAPPFGVCRCTFPFHWKLGGGGSSCFLSFVSPHELWSSFVSTFIWAATNVRSPPPWHRTGLAGRCRHSRQNNIHTSECFQAGKKNRSKNTSLLKNTPPHHIPGATQIWKPYWDRGMYRNDISVITKGIIQIRALWCKLRRVTWRWKRSPAFKVGYSRRDIPLSVRRLHISLPKQEWLGGGVTPPSLSPDL